MVEPTPKATNQGFIDSAQAAVRYIVVIVTAVIALLGLLKVHDVAGMIAYIQMNGGDVLAAISGLTAIGTAAYGVWKTHKRGVQAALPMVNPKV